MCVDNTFQDCNNLYGYAMMMKLPHSEFRWLSSEELSQFDIDGFDAMGDYGVVLEVISQNLTNKNQSKLMKRNQINLLLLSQVDLLYPDYLHDEHRGEHHEEL